METVAALVVYGVLTFVVCYVLYLVVRIGVEHGIRRALPEEALRRHRPDGRYPRGERGRAGEQL